MSAVNIETAWRLPRRLLQGIKLPPNSHDLTCLYQPHLGKKAGLILWPASQWQHPFYHLEPHPRLPNYVSTDHFMEHLGGGIRY